MAVPVAEGISILCPGPFNPNLTRLQLGNISFTENRNEAAVVAFDDRRQVLDHRRTGRRSLCRYADSKIFVVHLQS